MRTDFPQKNPWIHPFLINSSMSRSLLLKSLPASKLTGSHNFIKRYQKRVEQTDTLSNGANSSWGTCYTFSWTTIASLWSVVFLRIYSKLIKMLTLFLVEIRLEIYNYLVKAHSIKMFGPTSESTIEIIKYNKHIPYNKADPSLYLIGGPLRWWRYGEYSLGVHSCILRV